MHGQVISLLGVGAQVAFQGEDCSGKSIWIEAAMDSSW